MMQFLTYEVKVAAILLVFYLFYRFLLKKETFHRLNRAVLVGTAVLSFLLPFCIITIHKTVDVDASPMNIEIGEVTASTAIEALSNPWWQTALFVLFWAGVAFVFIRVAISILSIRRIIRQGRQAKEEDGCRIIVTYKEIDPFSWMRYIVLSQADYQDNPSTVIAHEKAHIRYRHSLDVLLVDILAAFQWFNPAIWMLRSDLKEIHEYEADDAVLRGGADLKDYQYLLIRKAVGKSGYSVANSFNHSILKKRITMMSKSKSPLARGLRALYVLPLVCLGLVLQAQTVVVPKEQNKDNKNPQIGIYTAIGKTPLFIVWELGQEKEVSSEEFSQIDPGRIKSMDILNDQQAIDKYGPKAANGVVKVTMKRPQELDEIVVIHYKEQSDDLDKFYLVSPETMPRFQGGDMNNFSQWLSRKISAPCNHSGTVMVGFEVGSDGSVSDVKIMESVCEEIDAAVLSAVSQSPKWEPATEGGRPVAQYLTIPIVFRIREDTKSK